MRIFRWKISTGKDVHYNWQLGKHKLTQVIFEKLVFSLGWTVLAPDSQGL